MYSTITEDADNKGADRCQRDAEAIMVFVSRLYQLSYYRA